MWNGFWECFNSVIKIIEVLLCDVVKIKISDQNNENFGNV